MNRSERLRRARAFHRTQARQEVSARNTLQREFNLAVQQAASAYPAWKPTISEHRKRLQKILEQIAIRGAAAGWVFSRESVAVDRKRAPTERDLSRWIRAWAKAHAAEKVVHISDTTRRRINHAVVQGLAANESPAQIAKRIRTDVQPMNRARSATIARTETAAAMMTGQDEAATVMTEELGLTIYKTWTAADDERTRDTHRDADGQTVKQDDLFVVGGARLRFPSDPNGPPEEVINCRCVPVYEAR